MKIINSGFKSGVWLAAIAILFMSVPGPCAGAAVTARAIAALDRVTVGEPFEFRIRISMAMQAEPPDLSALADFNVIPLGGGTYSNESFNNTNGRSTRERDHGYEFTYQLTPRRDGKLGIPAIAVKADGQIVNTQPLTITVSKPVEIDGFKLRLKLSKNQCYVAEPVILEVVWYLDEQVRSGEFTLPRSTDDSFRLFDPYRETNSANLVGVLVGGKIVQAEEGRETLDGKSYRTLRFQKVLIPEREGVISLEPATVVFELPVEVGNNSSPGVNQAPNNYSFRRFAGPRGGSGGSSFSFGAGSSSSNNVIQPANLSGHGRLGLGFRGSGSTRRVVIPSNSLTLTVKPLPTQGRPPGFFGLVGDYEITTSADPVEANVGDPITLTMKLSGSPGLDHVNLPPLTKQPAFTNNFKVAADLPDAKAVGKEKHFAQTIRALRSDVVEVPPVELPYFDTGTETYQVARSKPVPVKIHPVKVVSLGGDESKTGDSSVNKNQIQTPGFTRKRSDLNAFLDRAAASWKWMLILLLASMISWHWICRRRWNRMNSQNVQCCQAHTTLAVALDRIPQDDPRTIPNHLLFVLRAYLGGRLGMIPGVLTASDVTEPLAARGVPGETILALQEVIQRCQAVCYGGISPSDPGALLMRCREMADDLERALD